MSIFKANDIRGHYGVSLTEEHVYYIARAFVQFLKAKSVIVGRDNRLSSPALTEALINGLIDQGADVIDLGLIDSPGLYFATASFSRPGLMVTASHNPAEDNGLYLCNANAVPIYEKNGLKKIEELAKKARFPEATREGQVETVSITLEYLKHIFSFINTQKLRRIKIVIDCSNGVGAWIAPKVFDELPFEVIYLYDELDGSYPNHTPNPADPKNMVDLGNKVREEGADFGIAFDGDADRAGFVDEQGNVIEGSYIGSLLAMYLLARSVTDEKEKVVYSSTCSRIVPETITSAHAKPLMDRVGHTFMKTRMRKEHALLGIENSGHYFFRDNFYADSGIIASILIAECYCQFSQSFSELIAPFRKYYKADDVNFSYAKPEQALAKVNKEVTKLKPLSIKKTDGIIADLGDSWFSVRASHTEPYLRLSLEAETEKIGQKKVAELKAWIERTLQPVKKSRKTKQ